MKPKTKTENLTAELRKLCAKYDSDEVFTALTNFDNGYLQDEVITWLRLYKKLNVVKLEGLNQQMAFEESMNQIIPHDNQRQEQLFLTY